MEYRKAKRVSGNRIDCEINHPEHGWIPFTCDPKDTGARIDVVSLYAAMDSDPATAAYVPPTQEELDAEAAGSIRAARDQRLRNEVDPLVTNPLRWAELTEEKRAEWTAYRRALLDVPQQAGFPHNVVWPTKPE